MKINYRPEIDGLRAIAVSAVILYHSKIPLFGIRNFFSGGFIGVDIFFVISGYLITSIILKELSIKGSFSFKHFYERRIRRILPVLLFVMLVSLVFAWMYLLPSSLVDFSKSVIYSIIFISNIFFYNSGQEYDAESGLFVPFLHTWSLSVEEQFYILFPIILFLIFKFFQKYLIHFLVASFLISFVLANWYSLNYPSISFYFIHTRMWELLAGSILAYFEINKSHPNKKTVLNLISPFVGILFIIFPILLFNNNTLHPSLYTLVPVIGVSLIIWFASENELVTKVLSSRLFVSIGLISYSLYLWHYPIFAFARITYFFEDNFIMELLSGPLILILSISSYYLIEKPFRNKKYKFKKIFTILLLFILILISSTLLFINQNGFEKRVPKMFRDNLEYKGVDKADYVKNINTQKIVLIGDSHAEALTIPLNEKIKENNLSLFRFGTRMYINNFKQQNERFNDRYLKDNEDIDNFFKNNSNLIIVFHQRWTDQIGRIYFHDNNQIEKSKNPNHNEQLKIGLISKINETLELGHKLIVVYPVPEMGFISQRLLYRKYLFDKGFKQDSIPILYESYEKFKSRNKLIFEILDSISHHNIFRVYPHEFFCNTTLNNKCIANDEENIFYYDEDHLSPIGSEIVVNEIIEIIKKIKFK